MVGEWAHMFVCFMFFSLIFGLEASATEVDSFTDRFLIKSDSLIILDREVNRRLNKAIDIANRQKGCSKKALFNQLGPQLRAGPRGFFMISPLEYFANENADVKGKRHHRAKSIYRRVGLFDSMPIVVYPLGKLILVNGHYVSGDKFSHFLNVGWRYYQDIYEKGQSIEDTLRWGQKTERGFWGLAMTGVYSNADLVANYDGLRFWSTLFGGIDEEGVTREATISCVDDQWQLNRAFSWADWINAGWDEAINCNEYAPNVQRAILAAATDSPFQQGYLCPHSITQCRDVAQHYQRYGVLMFDKICIGEN